MSSDESEYQSLEERATRMGSALEVGAKVGQYKLDKRMGKGGMGEVWRAIDPTRGDEENPGYVALKFLPREIHESPRELRRALETFRAVQALQHPNICPVYFLQEFPRYVSAHEYHWLGARWRRPVGATLTGVWLSLFAGQDTSAGGV